MEAPSAAGARWQPTFPYSQAEALGYVQQLLSQVAHRLESQFGETLRSRDGWAIAAGVPVHWQQETQSAYEMMLRQAFPETAIRLVNEPTGALQYYALQGMLPGLATAPKDQPAWTLVIDLGGGTTDLVLAQIEMAYGRLRIGEIKSYGERYGGIDFDLMLAHHAATELGVTLDGGLLSQWKFQAKELKEAFSAQVQQEREVDASLRGGPAGESTVTVGFPVPREGGSFVYAPVALGQSAFTRVAGDLVERFRSVLERGLEHFRVSPQEVGQVVLTGGGAHWFFVQDTVKELLPHAHLLIGVEPEMSISQGLSLAGAQMREDAPVGAKPVGAVLKESPILAPVTELSPRPSQADNVFDPVNVLDPIAAMARSAPTQSIASSVPVLPPMSPGEERLIPDDPKPGRTPEVQSKPPANQAMPVAGDTSMTPPMGRDDQTGTIESPAVPARPVSKAVAWAFGVILILGLLLSFLLGHHKGIFPATPTTPSTEAAKTATVGLVKPHAAGAEEKKLGTDTDALNRRQADFDRKFLDWQKREQRVNQSNLAAVTALNTEGAKLNAEQNTLANLHQNLQERIDQSQRMKGSP